MNIEIIEDSHIQAYMRGKMEKTDGVRRDIYNRATNLLHLLPDDNEKEVLTWLNYEHQITKSPLMGEVITQIKRNRIFKK